MIDPITASHLSEHALVVDEGLEGRQDRVPGVEIVGDGLGREAFFYIEIISDIGVHFVVQGTASEALGVVPLIDLRESQALVEIKSG